jgi:pilus assembly protein CpaB
VLVAARALPSGHLLTDDDVRWQAWPDDDVAGSYILKPGKPADGLAGAVVREAIAAGEPITGERLIRRGDHGFLAAFLAPGRRAITIAIAANPLLNGLVGPGDRVDLIRTMPPPTQVGQRKPKPPVSETLLHDVKLLALDQRLDDHPGDFPTPHTATLEVTPKQAEMIALAADHAKFSLSLRSNTVPEASEDEPGPLAWDDTPEAPLAPPLRTEPVAGGKVSIIRGGSVSELDFAHPVK